MADLGISFLRRKHTDTSHYLQLLPEECRSVMFGPPCIRVKKQRNIKSWDQQNYLVIRGFCYIRPLYNEVPLYQQINKRIPFIKLLVFFKLFYQVNFLDYVFIKKNDICYEWVCRTETSDSLLIPCPFLYADLLNADRVRSMDMWTRWQFKISIRC